MAADTSEKQGFLSRTISMKWAITAGVGLIVLLVVIVVIVLVVDRGKDEAADAAAGGGGTSPTAASSPYELTELPAGVDIDAIEDSAFLSIFLPNDQGSLTSYGISSELPAAQALTEAMLDAEEVGADEAAAVLGARAADSTITFVLPTRETLTFALYVEEGMIARGSEVWRPQGDLKALVEAATAGP